MSRGPAAVAGSVSRCWIGAAVLVACVGLAAWLPASAVNAPAVSRRAPGAGPPPSRSPQYQRVQRRLARGWNTWDVHSVMTQVLLPEGLAIQAGLKHNTTEGGEAYLSRALIGQLAAGAAKVTPGPHSWDGSYTDLRIAWHGHRWRLQSAHEGSDLVMLAMPLGDKSASALPPSIVFTVDFLWNRPGTAERQGDLIATRGPAGAIPVYCTCAPPGSRPRSELIDLPTGGPYFAADLTGPVGISTGRRRSLAQIEAAIAKGREAYEASIRAAGKEGPIVDAIETTMGWDTIFEPDERRVITPVSRVWSVSWGGYVLFDWDNFFAATLAAVGDRDLAYANVMETLRGETREGFVPNYARSGGWKSFDRSEPPVGAITVLGLYRRFHDRWLLTDTFEPLLRWNRWWAAHRDIDGYLAWGSDGENPPGNLDDDTRGTRAGAILESGLDNSPMYDRAAYDPHRHVLEYADVGLMSLYIADCNALAQMARILGRPAIARELTGRAAYYRARLATLWSDRLGIFLNKNLRTGRFSTRLSPTNFYPMLAHAATARQARIMIRRHLLNPREFWGRWVIPSIARDDPAFHEQNYWRGRIWGPMNYLVYLGLRRYDDAAVRRRFARKSYQLFLGEWTRNRHVQENYNAITGSGDDVRNSDRFYLWGALLGYIEYLEERRPLGP